MLCVSQKKIFLQIKEHRNELNIDRKSNDIIRVILDLRQETAVNDAGCSSNCPPDVPYILGCVML